MKTEELMGALSGEKDFESVTDAISGEFTDDPLAALMEQLMGKYGVSRSELIARANLERSYAYQIFSGRRTPSRDRLIQLAIGMGADLEDTQKLLSRGGRNELYPRIKRDAAIIYCIGKGWSLMDCQMFLDSHGFEALKE